MNSARILKSGVIEGTINTPPIKKYIILSVFTFGKINESKAITERSKNIIPGSNTAFKF